MRRRGYGLPEGELPEGQERPPWGAGLTALAMTVVVGGWFFCMNGAVIADDRRNAVRPAWRIWKNIDTRILSTALQNFVEKRGKIEE